MLNVMERRTMKLEVEETLTNLDSEIIILTGSPDLDLNSSDDDDGVEAQGDAGFEWSDPAA